MADDPYRLQAMATEALMKADEARRQTDISSARFEERSIATDRRFDQIEATLRQQREEAKAEHREQQQAAADIARKVDALVSTVKGLETAGAASLEDRKMSTTIKVSLIGLAGILGGGTIAAVTQILGNHA